jgi:serine/threonine protein kinase
MTACLDVDELVAMAERGVAAHRRDVVLAHIDRCSHCAEVVAHLGALDRRARCIGRYQIERVIGAGGMGIVYAAYDPRLERRVAIKLVRPENTGGLAQQLIIAEGRAQAQIAHPNVVTVYDTGDHEGQVYLATELVEGTTLAEWQAQPRSTTEIVGAWIQVARGLAAAHAVGVVHGDVKARNVLVGGGGRIQIGDFGLARRDPPTTDVRPTSAVVGGTPQYMAPEHHTGNVEARSDQYSACVAIAEALIGTRPEANHVVSVESRALAAVLTRGLRRDPDERFASMDDLADALAAAIAPSPRLSRGSALVAMAASVMIAAATLVALLNIG